MYNKQEMATAIVKEKYTSVVEWQKRKQNAIQNRWEKRSSITEKLPAWNSICTNIQQQFYNPDNTKQNY